MSVSDRASCYIGPPPRSPSAPLLLLLLLLLRVLVCDCVLNFHVVEVFLDQVEEVVALRHRALLRRLAHDGLSAQHHVFELHLVVPGLVLGLDLEPIQLLVVVLFLDGCDVALGVLLRQLVQLSGYVGRLHTPHKHSCDFVECRDGQAAGVVANLRLEDVSIGALGNVLAVLVAYEAAPATGVRLHLAVVLRIRRVVDVASLALVDFEEVGGDGRDGLLILAHAHGLAGQPVLLDRLYEWP
mmetsp:Transcript_31206/g.90548  ORF Transcript_31206/g.90548 Transcript_31206/m.90548 type:complete len:241 (-) Transcript_31206:868-1590(-)